MPATAPPSRASSPDGRIPASKRMKRSLILVLVAFPAAWVPSGGQTIEVGAPVC